MRPTIPLVAILILLANDAYALDPRPRRILELGFSPTIEQIPVGEYGGSTFIVPISATTQKEIVEHLRIGATLQIGPRFGSPEDIPGEAFDGLGVAFGVPFAIAGDRTELVLTPMMVSGPFAITTPASGDPWAEYTSATVVPAIGVTLLHTPDQRFVYAVSCRWMRTRGEGSGRIGFGIGFTLAIRRGSDWTTARPAPKPGPVVLRRALPRSGG